MSYPFWMIRLFILIFFFFVSQFECSPSHLLDHADESNYVFILSVPADDVRRIFLWINFNGTTDSGSEMFTGLNTEGLFVTVYVMMIWT